MLVLDNLENPNQTIQENKQLFLTNRVIGKLSSRKVNIEEFKNKKCYGMADSVTTKNNDEFI